MNTDAKNRKIKGLFCPNNFFTVLLHPFFIAVNSIIAWFFTLYKSRILLWGRWGNYNCCKPDNSLNKFFYLTQWLNIDRYGLTGVSPFVGLGNHSLAKWFQISLFSSFLFANAGLVTILLGTVLWCLGNLVWVFQIQWQWVTLVTIVQLFSCLSYYLAFYGSNYNIIGWIWLPLSLYGVLNNEPLIVCGSFFCGSFGSITMVFSGSMLVMPYCLIFNRFDLLFALIPAYLKLLLHLCPMFFSGNLRIGLANTAKLIGLTKISVKYKRSPVILSSSSMYWLLLNIFACFCLWYFQASLILPVTSLALYLMNQNLIRFMDVQSCYILNIAAFSVAALTTPWSWPVLVAFFVLVNPFPRFLFGRNENDSMVRVPLLRPFDHSKLLRELDTFLKDVPQQARIIMAYSDPGENYSLIFDGYRVLNEPILYVASLKRIHLLPDWHAIAETNYDGAPNLWGRSIEEVKTNLRDWKADYAIIYTEGGMLFDQNWFDEFEVVASFDWAKWQDAFGQDSPWVGKLPPKWWLLVEKNEFA